MTLEHDHAAHSHDDHDDPAGHDHGDHAGHQHVAYPDAVAGYRAEKDEFFRNEYGSPIPEADRGTFAGLPYFQVDEGLRFEGLTLEPYTGNEPVMFQIPTSDGRLRDAQRAGILRFDLNGAQHALTGYSFAEGGSESVFVPFLDLTSGTETYGAGRYLDLYAEDQAAEVQRLLGLGATEVHWDKRPPDADYVIMADPEGNRFCVIDINA